MNEDMWEELKKFIKSEQKSHAPTGRYNTVTSAYRRVLDKMKELEDDVGEPAFHIHDPDNDNTPDC